MRIDWSVGRLLRADRSIDRSVVLVAGAAGEVGQATAARLGQLGARLVLVVPDRTALKAADRPNGARIVVADLAEPGAPDWVAGEAIQAMGRVDVLVNYAWQRWSSATIPDEELERLVRADLLAPLRLTRALLPAMLDVGRGRIVTVTSSPPQAGEAAAAAHGAARAGLLAFTESLRNELAGTGVSVRLVSAGIWGAGLPGRTGRVVRRWAESTCTRRVAHAVARAVAEPGAEGAARSG